MADEQPIIIKKKKVGGHGHHGGAWKLAYADFVTAMMAFFLVMWIIGLDVKTKAGLAEYFANPGAFRINTQSSPYIMQLNGKPPLPQDRVRESARRMTQVDTEAAETLQARIQTAINSEPRLAAAKERTDFSLTDDGLRIEFLETSSGLLFAPKTATPTPLATQLLQAIAPMLIGSGKGMHVEGHTDTRPAQRSDYGPWEIAGERASVVRRLLAGAGVKPQQFLSVSSYGPLRLRLADTPGDVSNNRIVLLIPFVTE